MALSFRPRIALWSALLSGIVLLVFFAVTAWMVFDNMVEEADEELRVLTQIVAIQARGPDADEGDDLDGDHSGLAYRMVLGAPGTGIRETYSGTISAEPAEARLVELTQVTVRSRHRRIAAEGWPDAAEGSQYTKRGWSATRRIDGTLWREMYRRIGNLEIRMAIDLQEIQDEVMSMVNGYLRFLPVALVFIGLGAWWVAGRAAKPINKIIATAEHITPAGLGERIRGVESHDELGRLAGVLNRMMDRIESAFQQQRRFSSDASHELRTPLTVMQGKIEAALQDADRNPEDAATYVELLERVGQLRAIIDSLLLLSRSDAGSLVPDRGELSLAELVVDVLEDTEILADDAGLTLASEVFSPAAKVSGDGRLLRLAISNLLTNAVKYNREGGEVRCELHEVSGGFAVVVRNTGPPIEGVEREKIFERFYRADPARGAAKPGTGLGLSLAQVIAKAHGGRLNFEGSRDGWNTFVLRLPHATRTSAEVDDAPTG